MTILAQHLDKFLTSGCAQYQWSRLSLYPINASTPRLTTRYWSSQPQTRIASNITVSTTGHGLVFHFGSGLVCRLSRRETGVGQTILIRT
jgi:hypothetical protein